MAVPVDGDRPGAQKLGARFKVRGYPTVILMNPQGAEITRLPGEADAQQVMAVLRAGLSGGRPIQQVLADARSGKALSTNEWRTLAYYSWETDESQLVAPAQRPNLLAELAAKVPQGTAGGASREVAQTHGEIATRLPGEGLNGHTVEISRIHQLIHAQRAYRRDCGRRAGRHSGRNRRLGSQRGSGRHGQRRRDGRRWWSIADRALEQTRNPASHDPDAEHHHNHEDGRDSWWR